MREDTTEKYFADLTQDAFSKDLLRFKEVIRTSVGEKYRYKALTEAQFEELISITYNRIVESPVVKSPDDLKRLIFANGIMAEKITTKGRYYRFAPIYWYSWGLVNSALEKEEKKKTSKVESTKALEEGQTYTGQVIEVKDRFGRIRKKVKCANHPHPLEIRDEFFSDYYEDDMVTFTAKKEANRKDSSKSFWYATNIQVK